ncbi:hypothetical protein A1O3_04841 [Capronia epimyces CBS 606.96]|uniref:Uncharacterized protein n=1 Tax=Capronia epimyces CBS 606.96 TaxID=1182542 RepID=W9YPI1_9EURO|nr:uncharacterized protein A1O3_04841 [Capronia epimyces CBS 606.96]EXJ84174.1 hypothetical protein A1O3_04841 [Capronia epimyces CBS 606.96]
MRELENRRAGRVVAPQPWLKFPLSPSAFPILRQKLSGNYYYSKQRYSEYSALKLARFSLTSANYSYDYFGSTSKFVLRKPSPTHGTSAVGVLLNIERELDTFRSGDLEVASKFAREIELRLSTDVESNLEMLPSSHSPDISWGHLDHSSGFPGLIVEIAYSQKRKALKDLAYEYFCTSLGKTRIMIGVDIESSGKSRKATLLMWKSWLEHDATGAQVKYDLCAESVFRNDDGSPNLDSGIEFSLQEIAPDAPFSEQVANCKVRIDGAKLYERLCNAEELEKAWKTEAKEAKEAQERPESAIRLPQHLDRSPEEMMEKYPGLGVRSVP